MKKLNPRKYEYLWTDCDINFIFVSCYLFSNFRQADIVLIYKWKTRELQFFLSSEQRKKFAHYGLSFYQGGFSAWARKMKVQLIAGQRLIEQTRKDRKIIKKMSMSTLAHRIGQRANFFQVMGNLYFYTEFFFLDEVEKVLQHKNQSNKRLGFNMNKMALLKLKARKVLNEFYNFNCIFKPYIDKAGQRLKRSDLPWLSIQEILRLLQGDYIPVSNRRTNNWVLAMVLDWRLILGRQAGGILKAFNQYFFSRKKKIITGICANPGKFKGKARIIKTVFSEKVADEIMKVRQGDVLVANTTGPELTTAIKKAGAIVTDEGGLTSHAAIIARELKIPCVVGTKIATQVLKDGDKVEVDAYKGEVKKL